jgi:hypothetical protein
MTNGEEKKIRGPLGIWGFPVLNKAATAERQKQGEGGVIDRAFERAPGILIDQAGNAAGKAAANIAGNFAKDAVTDRLSTGILARRPGLLL